MQLNGKTVCGALTVFALILFVLLVVFPTKEGFATPYPPSNRARGMPCYNDRQCKSGMCSQEKCT
jgi:hypothetical protein